MEHDEVCLRIDLNWFGSILILQEICKIKVVLGDLSFWEIKKVKCICFHKKYLWKSTQYKINVVIKVDFKA